MTQILEEWFKRVEIRLKYELPHEYYEKVMSVMLSELKILYEEENKKQDKTTD